MKEEEKRQKKVRDGEHTEEEWVGEGAGSDSNNQQYPAEHQGHQGRGEKIVMTTASLTILPAQLMMSQAFPETGSGPVSAQQTSSITSTVCALSLSSFFHLKGSCVLVEAVGSIWFVWGGLDYIEMGHTHKPYASNGAIK